MQKPMKCPPSQDHSFLARGGLLERGDPTSFFSIKLCNVILASTYEPFGPLWTQWVRLPPHTPVRETVEIRAESLSPCLHHFHPFLKPTGQLKIYAIPRPPQHFRVWPCKFFFWLAPCTAFPNDAQAKIRHSGQGTPEVTPAGWDGSKLWAPSRRTNVFRFGNVVGLCPSSAIRQSLTGSFIVLRADAMWHRHCAHSKAHILSCCSDE